MSAPFTREEARRIAAWCDSYKAGSSYLRSHLRNVSMCCAGVIDHLNGEPDFDDAHET